MRFVLLTIVAFLQFTFLTAFSALAEGQISHGQAEKSMVKILALGDSLTAGYGLGAGDGLTDVLQAKLRAKGHEVTIINAGVSGDTTKGGLARLDWALADGPDLALVALGGNDMLRGLEPQDSYQNLSEILTILQKAKIPTLLAGMMAPANMGRDYQQEFDQLYPRLADEFDVVFYPFFLEGVALVPNLNQDDGLHPNEAGVNVITDNILPKVEELLQRRAGVHS